MSLWRYAAGLWRRSEIERLCLEIQDAQGLSPPLLLWRLWTLAEGRPLDAARLDEAVHAARAWEGEVTAPLRAARRALKAPRAVIADPARLALRETVRAVELDTERVLLEALEALTPPPGALAEDALDALTALAEAWPAPVPADSLARLLKAAGLS